MGATEHPEAIRERARIVEILGAFRDTDERTSRQLVDCIIDVIEQTTDEPYDTPLDVLGLPRRAP